MKSLRTCRACTCKDYVCRHSQPKWQCHFGSSLFSAREDAFETRPPSPEDGRSWGSRSITSTCTRCSCSPARGHWQVEYSASESPDGEVRTLPHPTQVGDGELCHHWRSGWSLGYCPGSKGAWTCGHALPRWGEWIYGRDIRLCGNQALSSGSGLYKDLLQSHPAAVIGPAMGPGWSQRVTTPHTQGGCFLLLTGLWTLAQLFWNQNFWHTATDSTRWLAFTDIRGCFFVAQVGVGIRNMPEILFWCGLGMTSTCSPSERSNEFHDHWVVRGIGSDRTDDHDFILFHHESHFNYIIWRITISSSPGGRVRRFYSAKSLQQPHVWPHGFSLENFLSKGTPAMPPSPNKYGLIKDLLTTIISQ